MCTDNRDANVFSACMWSGCRMPCMEALLLAIRKVTPNERSSPVSTASFGSLPPSLPGLELRSNSRRVDIIQTKLGPRPVDRPQAPHSCSSKPFLPLLGLPLHIILRQHLRLLHRSKKLGARSLERQHGTAVSNNYGYSNQWLLPSFH